MHEINKFTQLFLYLLLIFFSTTLNTESSELYPSWIINPDMDEDLIFGTGMSKIYNNNFYIAYIEALSHARGDIYRQIIEKRDTQKNNMKSNFFDIDMIIIKSSFVQNIWVSSDNNLFLKLVLNNSFMRFKFLIDENGHPSYPLKTS